MRTRHRPCKQALGRRVRTAPRLQPSTGRFVAASDAGMRLVGRQGEFDVSPHAVELYPSIEAFEACVRAIVPANERAEVEVERLRASNAALAGAARLDAIEKVRARLCRP